MSNFKKVTISEFLWLLTRAQKDHIEHGEPIPAINKQGQGIIEYCLEAPFKGIENVEYYPSFDCKAAVVFYDIANYIHCQTAIKEWRLKQPCILLLKTITFLSSKRTK